MTAQPAKRLFTVDEYHRMAEVGLLAEDDRVELIEGEIIRMSPIGIRHASIVDRLNALFTRKLGRKAIVRVQNPVILSRYTEPQPDFAILRARKDFYSFHHPEPDDALLVVEVMDSTAAYDRGVKLPLYVRTGVAEVWLIDVGSSTVHAFPQPYLRGYRQEASYRHGQKLAMAAFPRLSFAVSEILGPKTK